ncbi:MAG: hypothetical protein QOI59_6552 [Gammaproteobacteria bacterium]|nr:hypothetical protein [Gammaproteobacteria bacterium]
MKKFSDLTEREVLTVAIASEEDGRIYMSSQRTSDSYHNCASRRFSERYAMIRIVTWFTWLLVFGWACAAHASPVPPADPVWSTDRIARLPREVRERVLSACGPQARAGHYFATYDPHSDAIHLDYSLLECPDLSSFGGGISGLHQTFVRRAGGYVSSHSQRDVRRTAAGIGFSRSPPDQ